jgi:hypothetical protein
VPPPPFSSTEKRRSRTNAHNLAHLLAEKHTFLFPKTSMVNKQPFCAGVFLIRLETGFTTER